MNFKRVYAIFLRQILLLKKGHFRLMSLFYWSTLDLFLWGILSGYLGRVGHGRIGLASTLIGAVILSSFFFRVVQGITVAFLEDVWMRNFINLFASPLSIHEYMMGLVATSIFDTAVSLSFMMLLAWFLFAYNIFRFGFALIPFVAVLFVFGWAIGVFATAVVLRLGPSAEIFTWSIPALMTPFSAVFYPVKILPLPLQKIAFFVPAMHLFEGMRSALLDSTFSLEHLAWATILNLAYLACGISFFYWMVRAARKRGALSRLVTG